MIAVVVVLRESHKQVLYLNTNMISESLSFQSQGTDCSPKTDAKIADGLAETITEHSIVEENTSTAITCLIKISLHIRKL